MTSWKKIKAKINRLARETKIFLGVFLLGLSFFIFIEIFHPVGQEFEYFLLTFVGSAFGGFALFDGLFSK